jgi:hypothetical protein
LFETNVLRSVSGSGEQRLVPGTCIKADFFDERSAIIDQQSFGWYSNEHVYKTPTLALSSAGNQDSTPEKAIGRRLP